MEKLTQAIEKYEKAEEELKEKLKLFFEKYPKRESFFINYVDPSLHKETDWYCLEYDLTNEECVDINKILNGLPEICISLCFDISRGNTVVFYRSGEIERY